MDVFVCFPVYSDFGLVRCAQTIFESKGKENMYMVSFTICVILNIYINSVIVYVIIMPYSD